MVSAKQKIQENIDAELFDVCYNEAQEMGHKIKVVERTGAGDAFASGFVAGQIAGRSIMDSLKLGLKESESVIRYFGAKNKLLRMRLR